MRTLISMLFFFSISWVSAQEGIKIVSDYPGGNILVHEITKDTVRVSPDLSETNGEWFYWNFKITGIQGKTITFKFDSFKWEQIFSKFGPAYSINNDNTWKWYGEQGVGKKSFTYSFTEQDTTAYFSMAFPYTEKDLNKFLSGLRYRESILMDTLCISPEDRAIEKLIIKPGVGEPSYKVLITARHHACETMASYELEGIVQSILNERGLDYLRNNVEFMIIPFMDKDGVENGEQGKNRDPRDHNRDYSGDPIHNSTATLRNIIPEWSQGKLKIALDLHCPLLKGEHSEYIFLVGSPFPKTEKNQLQFTKLLEENTIGELSFYKKYFLSFGVRWNVANSYSKGDSFTAWAAKLPDVSLSTSLEFPYANVSGTMISKDGAREFGKAIAYSIKDYLLLLEKNALNSSGQKEKKDKKN